MKGRTSVSLLLALLTLAVVATPAGAAQDLPSDLWNPLPPDPSAPAQSSGGVSPLLVLAVCALVAVAGFLIGERLPLPARGKPEEAKPPRVSRRQAARFWRFEGCTIALARSGTTGEFEVVVGRGAQKQVIGRSPLLGFFRPARLFFFGATCFLSRGGSPRFFRDAATPAATMLLYAPHRQRFPATARFTSSSRASGSARRSATTDMTWPGVQNPH